MFYTIRNIFLEIIIIIYYYIDINKMIAPNMPNPNDTTYYANKLVELDYIAYLRSLLPKLPVKKEKKFYWVFNKYGCKRKCYYYVEIKQ